jgi:hypothetical protein
MENKYFTPDIEDLCVGYELVSNLEKQDIGIGRVPLRISKDNISHVLSNIDNYEVPYLTNEQIEAEGWKYYQNIPDVVVPEGYVEYYKDVEWFKVVISIGERSHYLTVEKVFQNVQVGSDLQEFRNTIYNGECKDINTFRKIIKLLEI